MVRNATERAARERALAESRSQLAREHASVVALQAAILPRELPPVHGADLAAAYVAGADNLDVGGDWFDAFALPDGAVAIAIGDVAGKGIEAAQVMAQLRSAGRVAARGGQDPAGVLSAQNTLMLAGGLGPFATTVFGVYRPATGVLAWASAGHLPPLVAPWAGRLRRMTIPPDLPLGAYPGAARRNTDGRLPTDACLFLYTDGLVERRDASIAIGMDLLMDALTCAPADTVCATAMATMFADRAASDDVAILAVRRTKA